MVDNKRKERYEVLYEDLLAKMEILTDHVLSLGERMDRSFKEIRKEIAEFKSDVKSQFEAQNKRLDRVEYELSSVKEEIKMNRKWLIKHDKQLDRHEKILVNG